MSATAGQSHDSIVRKPILTEKEANFKEKLFQKHTAHGEPKHKSASVVEAKNPEVDKQLNTFMNEMAHTLKRTAAGKQL